MNRYYYPIQNIVNFFVNKYTGKKILEVGPGNNSFPGSTFTIDILKKADNNIQLDICMQPLPFPDNFFDFTYCRHVLEDVNNPLYALKEIIRVSKAFYIETPSPLIEISKNIEFYVGTTDQTSHTGYMHHRFVIWYEQNKNHIHLLPKYSVIEHNICYLENKQPIETYTTNRPKYWNTYIYIEKNKMKIPEITNYVHTLNMSVHSDYNNLLLTAVNENITSTNYFFSETIPIEEQFINTIYIDKNQTQQLTL
jgi:SAM-dependent methyltransferase